MATVPLDIDFHEEDVARHALPELDSILSSAWDAGAEALLLRDDCPPQLHRAGRWAPLAGGDSGQGALVRNLLDVTAPVWAGEALEGEGACRWVYRVANGPRLRCIVAADGGELIGRVRRIGEEHLAPAADAWLPAPLVETLPADGLVIVSGGAEQGKTCTAAALAASRLNSGLPVVALGDPLERRLTERHPQVLHLQLPDAQPHPGAAFELARRLGARTLLVDLVNPRPLLFELLALAGEGRLVIATWPLSADVPLESALMDALPGAWSVKERSRRLRLLRLKVEVTRSHPPGVPALTWSVP